MKLVRRVPRTSPLHMDLQGFPCHSILVTCSQRGETLVPGTRGLGGVWLKGGTWTFHGHGNSQASISLAPGVTQPWAQQIRGPGPAALPAQPSFARPGKTE